MERADTFQALQANGSEMKWKQREVNRVRMEE